MNSLTDRDFWVNYWETKSGLIFRVPDKYLFLSLLRELLRNNKTKSLLEIGGFPGYYSVWAKREMAVEATLLDFVVHEQIVRQLEVVNGVDEQGITTLEADLFEYIPNKKFDLVMSNGLIEHFEDTRAIIQRHIDFLSEQGVLFISLPNFRGLNGWFQKTFDPDNYNKHFIGCMDVHYLNEICEQLSLKNVKVGYSGRFMLWLEDERRHQIWVRIVMRVTWLSFKLVTRVFPFESRFLSPHIIITAYK